MLLGSLVVCHFSSDDAGWCSGVLVDNATQQSGNNVQVTHVTGKTCAGQLIVYVDIVLNLVKSC